MNAHVPVIDVAGIENPARFPHIAQEIGAAARSIGFFYVKNHSVPRALMEETFVRSRAFFALPLEEKQLIAIEKIGGNRGYSGLKHEALDPNAGGDLKEAFNIGLDLSPDDPEILARAPFRTLNAWPKVPPFRATLLAYYDACMQLALEIHRAFAADLELPLDFFADKFRKPMTTLRLLRYPAASIEGEVGAGEHTDYGNITLLATDDVGGLEVRTRSGEWIAAPPRPGAFVVNIGDCLMRWTNDVYASTPHRVVNRSGRERCSIAFFVDPDPDARVEAIPGCVPAGEKPRHPPVLAADYLRMRLDATKI